MPFLFHIFLSSYILAYSRSLTATMSSFFQFPFINNESLSYFRTSTLAGQLLSHSSSPPLYPLILFLFPLLLPPFLFFFTFSPLISLSFFYLSFSLTGPETMVRNSEKHRINFHSIIHSPTRSVSKVSKQANEWVQQNAWAKQAVRSKVVRSRQCEASSAKQANE